MKISDRTPTTEVERILNAINGHFKSATTQEGANDEPQLDLMRNIVAPMMRDIGIANDVIAKWANAKSEEPVELLNYLGCVYLVAALCVKAEVEFANHRLNEAWVNVVDAQLISGVALSMRLGQWEVSHAHSKKGQLGGKSKKSVATRDYAISLFESAKNDCPDPNIAAKKIATQVIDRAKVDGWTMTKTNATRTIRDWLKEHVESTRTG